MLRNSLLLGVLRASAARAHPPKFSLAASTRLFSNLFPQVHKIPGSLIFQGRNPRFLYQPCSHRMLSLGSIFSQTKPVAAPTPLVVAHITRLEAEANVHPHDTAKQLALFEALLETNLKSSYELIITRWEKMCEFDPASPLLKSPAAFKMYLTSLQNNGQTASISTAVQKRESLLAAQEIAVADGTDPAVTDSSGSTKASELGHSSSWQPTSQDIARDVLATPIVSPLASSNPVLDSWRQTLNGTTAQTAPIQVSIVERKTAWIAPLIRFLVYVGFTGFFLLAVLSVFFENSGLMKVGTHQSEFEPVVGNVVKFSDVQGVDEAKEELRDVVLFLKDPASFTALGGKLPKGVLLTGPPGTGKTMLARAVAGEANVPFFFASGSDFEEVFVGVGAKRVRELFAAARKKEPSIIFIDELDAVGGKRSNRDQQYLKQTLNQLLVEMDGFQQSEGVIVIAATNFPESLDPALVRPGRFDKHVAVVLPDIRGRVQILQHHMRGVTIAKDVDPKVLARGTPGFSGADLQNMVNQAAVQASKLRAKEVELAHFEWAKDRIIMGVERKSHYIDPETKLSTAYHEGGHALVALYTDGAMPLHKVTCVPRGHALGITSQLPKDDGYSVSYKQYLSTIDVCMGGRVAEELIYGKENISSGASSDIQKATKTAESMVKYWGFSKLGPVFHGDSNGSMSPRKKEEIEEEVSSLVRGGEARATALLTSKMTELHRLAHALVEHETLNLEEVKKVIEGEPLRTIGEILEDGDI